MGLGVLDSFVDNQQILDLEEASSMNDTERAGIILARLMIAPGDHAYDRDVAVILSALGEVREAERERCAKRLEQLKWQRCTPTSSPFNRGLNNGADTMHAECISAIRSSNEPERANG